jgi:hypothetical protein
MTHDASHETSQSSSAPRKPESIVQIVREFQFALSLRIPFLKSLEVPAVSGPRRFAKCGLVITGPLFGSFGH